MDKFFQYFKFFHVNYTVTDNGWRKRCIKRKWNKNEAGFLDFIPYFFIFRHSDSAVAEDAGIELMQDFCDFGISSQTL